MGESLKTLEGGNLNEALGHCYEKVIKLINPNIKTFSYQSTPLSKSQFSMKYYNNDSLPDIILAKNNLYKDFLENNLNITTKIINFGDLKYQKNIETKIKGDNNSILLIPEGLHSEVNIMINFILENCEKCPNYNFTIRFHPIYPKKEINNLKLKFKGSKNVFFSNNSIISDFQKNSYVIYRGSSLIFKAMQYKLIPIYLNQGINVNILDIFKLKNNIFNSDENFDEKYIKKLEFKDQFVKFISSYFINCNYDKLLNEFEKKKIISMI